MSDNVAAEIARARIAMGYIIATCILALVAFVAVSPVAGYIMGLLAAAFGYNTAYRLLRAARSRP